jgi:tripartite-type tricarboxylate transporter receptor subunit TctC
MTAGRRVAVAGAVLLVTALDLPGAQHDFPSKPIRLVIPFTAGGASDLTARTFVDLAPTYLGQPIVIQIRPGGGGAIGSELVSRAAPDGYTLLFGHTNSNSLLPAIEGRSRGPQDLRAVCRVSVTASMFVASPDAPFRDLRELIVWAGANPGKLAVSVPGPWSAVGLTWKQMERTLGLELRIVSFDGGSDALVALLGGHVHASLLALPQTRGHIRAGKLRALAWAGTARHASFPDVPTAAEQGYPHTLTVFKGVMAPRGTPDAIVERLAEGFKAMVETTRVQEDLRHLGDDVRYLGPHEFASYWQSEYDRFRTLQPLWRR